MRWLVPRGPIEAFKELNATTKSVLEAAASAGRGELVHAVATAVAEKTKQRQNPFKSLKPEGLPAGEQIVEELRAVNRLVTDKASPQGAAAFRELLLSAAQHAANAAKEGGFMGFHATRVSEGEQRMLDKLGEVLAPPPA